MLLKIEDWEVEWIPSHGKKPNWSAIEPANTKEYRQLNEAADAECTLALEPFIEGIKEWEKEWDKAHDWSRCALLAQAKATVAYMDFHAEPTRKGGVCIERLFDMDDMIGRQ